MPKVLDLSSLRRARAVKQNQLAKKLALKQAGLSQLERRNVLHTDSLRKYVEGAGGRLIVLACFDDGEEYILSPFSSGTQRVELPQLTKALLRDPEFQKGLMLLIEKQRKEL